MLIILGTTVTDVKFMFVFTLGEWLRSEATLICGESLSGKHWGLFQMIIVNKEPYLSKQRPIKF